MAAGPARDLIFTDELWEFRSLDKTAMAAHLLWTPVTYSRL